MASGDQSLTCLKRSSRSRYSGVVWTEVGGLNLVRGSPTHTTSRDFSNLQILTDLYKSLELSLKGHLTTSGLYMGMFLPLDLQPRLI